MTCSRGLRETQRRILIRQWLTQHNAWDAAVQEPRGIVSVVWNRELGTMTYQFHGKSPVRRAN